MLLYLLYHHKMATIPKHSRQYVLGRACNLWRNSPNAMIIRICYKHTAIWGTTNT